jgi:hypothetical protein
MFSRARELGKGPEEGLEFADAFIEAQDERAKRRREVAP